MGSMPVLFIDTAHINEYRAATLYGCVGDQKRQGASMRKALALSILAVLLLGIPSAVHAQALGTIAGVAKDTSDAVLPGVVVEASSPVLIEKTRSATTDGRGQFTIVNLPPGTYNVTFSLSGFAPLNRQGIEVSIGITASLNVTMKVGNVAETV